MLSSSELMLVVPLRLTATKLAPISCSGLKDRIPSMWVQQLYKYEEASVRVARVHPQLDPLLAQLHPQLLSHTGLLVLLSLVLSSSFLSSSSWSCSLWCVGKIPSSTNLLRKFLIPATFFNSIEILTLLALFLSPGD